MSTRQIEVCDVCGKDAPAKLRLKADCHVIDVCAECTAMPMTEVTRVIEERAKELRRQMDAQLQAQQQVGVQQIGWYR